MSEYINLNDDWKFDHSYQDEMIEVLYPDDLMQTVRLPHTNVITPFHYFDEQIYQFVSCYRKNLIINKEWEEKRVLITFEGVAHVAKVYLNGRLITTHYGGYTSFTVDLAPYLNFDDITANVLAVVVDSRETCNLPPFGNVIDYLTYGGIYREVSLTIKEAVSIEDVFIVTRDICDNKGNNQTEPTLTKEVELQVKLHGDYQQKELQYSIIDVNKTILYSNIAKIDCQAPIITFKVTGIHEWEPDHPVLYHLNLELIDLSDNNRILDSEVTRFGFRTCEFREDGFYLNHKKIKLLGLNRHQSYPYVGYAMPKRMQQQDAEILKQELQVNAVRTSHYPQSKHFINRCDELGLLVFTEIPGWQHIGDAKWKEIACENVKEMVLQYRNHPSIIIWGVRINESQDNDEFYQRTNRVARELDSTRQTGGVRYLKKSNLLEDVYTYNDFLHNGSTKGVDRKEDVTSNQKAPYLVTEFNGHMFPTKAFDNEEHRMMHALRHARVLDGIFEQDGIAGGFGWCMFDYNTHKDFGSGDRICYHGVMDMFRNPKLAAAVYASQSDVTDIFEVSSSLDIGEHPAGNIGEVYIFTNADSVKLYKNNTLIKEFYPNKDRYPHLPHPPILIDDFIGNLLEKQEHFRHKTAERLKDILMAVKKYGPNNLPLKYKIKMAFLMIKERMNMQEGTNLYYRYVGNWGGSATTFRFEAIRNNKVIKVIEKKPVNHVKLSIIVKDTLLHEDETYDVAEVRITAVDEGQNQLPYYQEPINLEVWGAIELIGPRTISFKGGATGVYIKTKGILGEGGLKIIQADLGEKEIKFIVK